MQVAKENDSKKYTYKDYLLLPEGEKWEIIDGTAYNMAPAPTIKHQRILRNITWLFGKQMEKLKGCEFLRLNPLKSKSPSGKYLKRKNDKN